MIDLHIQQHIVAPPSVVMSNKRLAVCPALCYGWREGCLCVNGCKHSIYQFEGCLENYQL